MSRLRELLLILVAFAVLAGCQTNQAGKAGYMPTSCGMVGSSCSRSN